MKLNWAGYCGIIIGWKRPWNRQISSWAWATARKIWPEMIYLTSAPPFLFPDELCPVRTLKDVLHEIVGDLQRILIYPAQGYQIPQEVPLRS